MLIARVRRGEEVLVPVLEPGNGAAQPASEPDEDDVFGKELHLLAEAAPDIGRDDAQIRFRHAERIGEPRAQHVRHLHRAGERHAAARLVPRCKPGARLQQGATYVDLNDLGRGEFTATGDMTAGPNNWYVAKDDVHYNLWNLLIGVETPERLGTTRE